MSEYTVNLSTYRDSAEMHRYFDQMLARIEPQIREAEREADEAIRSGELGIVMSTAEVRRRLRQMRRPRT